MSTDNRRFITLTVLATTRHCNNDCPYMSYAQSAPVSCTVFDKRLDWDKKRKSNGYKRLLECRRADQQL